MLIRRVSLLTGIERELDLPIDKNTLASYERGELLVQQAFPGLSEEEREFIMTGIYDDEWKENLGDDR